MSYHNGFGRIALLISDREFDVGAGRNQIGGGDVLEFLPRERCRLRDRRFAGIAFAEMS